ncbi:MAG: hypothetical protein U0746_20240 [Gemmataceae bacterium]
MFKTVFAAVAVALAGLSIAAVAAPSPARAASPEGRVEGTITAVNVAGSALTIKPVGRPAITVVVSAATKIERNGRRVALSGLVVGDRGQARLTVAGAATKVEAVGP